MLRAVYLFVAVGAGLMVWPPLLSHSPAWPLMNGVVCAMIGTVSILAALGIRYPLQMLPVLLFELLWKTVWLVTIALPPWMADALDAQRMATVEDCIPLVILIVAIPWKHIFSRYVKQPGDRWRNGTAAAALEPSVATLSA